jgi:acetyl esterase
MHTESDGASTTYICASGEALPILLAEPREHRPRSGVIFFHGGGWIGGGPEQFLPQCHALADADILSATARYRLLGSGASTLADCVADARAAVERFLNVAADHDLLPSRVAVGGGSAGAYLALSVALSLPGIGPDGSPEKHAAEPDSRSRSALPREAGETMSALGALVLFNPVVDLGALSAPFMDLLLQGTGMTGDELAQLSPVQCVRPGVPPTIVFHGTDDAVVPLDSVRHFRDRMEEEGNRCELVEFAGAEHGFFNARPGGNPFYDETLARATQFLVGLGRTPLD